MSINVDQMPF